ncbi:MAG TPA: GerMN domain-containing protein [Acidimicrobiales bacterium]|nr:GerMN domain-containing protein [Acidimicrobiales bacterium]
MTPSGRLSGLRAAGAAAALVALVILPAACGIPAGAGPHALSRDAIPFGLLQASTPTSTTTTRPPAVAVSVPIFLVGADGHLVSVARDVAVPAPMAGVLDALVDGPTASEAASGLSSALPPQTAVLSATVAGGIATVNLAGPFDQLVGQAQIQAVAQFVFTATGQPGVTGVAFELDGQAVQVPVAGGAQVPEANRSQFASLAPDAPTGTTEAGG